MKRPTRVIAPAFGLADDAQFEIHGHSSSIASVVTDDGEPCITVHVLTSEYATVFTAYCTVAAATALRDALTVSLDTVAAAAVTA